MKDHKWLILSGIVAAAVVLAWLGYSLRSGVAVRTIEVRVQTIREFVDERGETRLPDTYVITMPFSGRLDSKPINRLREGTRVSEGEPVARVVAEDIELAVHQARAAVERLDATIDENADVRVEQTVGAQAEKLVESIAESVKAVAARIDASRANYEYAQANLARTRELRRTNARTEDEWELAWAQHAEAAAAYRQDQLVYAAMVALEGGMRLMPDMIRQYIERKLDKSAEVLRRQRDETRASLDLVLQDQRRSIIVSPIDGVVLARRVNNERFIPAGEELLQIGRLDDLEVEADLLSIDAVHVRPGAPVEIYGPAVGEPSAKGTVARVYPAGFTKLSSLGVEQQRVKVVVEIDPADRARLVGERGVAVGYRVRIRITTATKDNALVVPRSALFRGDDGQWRVFVVRNGAARKQVVELGLGNDQEAEIVSGLERGEIVVDVPGSTLSDGVRVTADSKNR
ncbi:MAG: HlyD family efflux transporter periplasmic adaptor subunit [Thermoguttaceae bacterium]|jgi:HlyD family secretion protein|nr:HlyD family efflux transporter periplasmic adaptor subunit [Thermoguttaceae bacterium]